MSLSNLIVEATRQKVFFPLETTVGTPVWPTAGTAITPEAGFSFPSQKTEHTPLEEAINTRSVTALLGELRDAGEFSFSFVMRPSGTAGTAPAEGEILENMLGDETIVGGTSVTYDAALVKQTNTLWIQATDLVLFCTGVVVTGLKISEERKNWRKAEATCKFLRLGWTGETITNGALSGGETSVTVTDSEQFAVGSRINVGSSTNGGDGHEITAINYTTHALTVTPSITGAQGDGSDVVATDLPTPTLVGTPSETKPIVKINSTAIPWRSYELNIEETVEAVMEVAADPSSALAAFPSGWVAKGRKVTASVTAVLRTQNANKLRLGTADKSFELDMATNAAAGYKITITCAQGRYDVPELSTGDPAGEYALTFSAKASSTLEDEISWVYT